MHLLAVLILEFLLVSSCILILFNLRKKLGLAPLYILLGTLQYFQVNLENAVGLKILGDYPLYPGAIVLFCALLFAVLLIYIKEGVVSARTLILGILISNFFLTGLFEITAIQDYFIRNEHSDNNVFNSPFLSFNFKYFILGTVILFFDFLLLVIVYQFLISKIKKTYFFLILFLSLWTVLVFDAVAFNTAVFYGTPDYMPSLIGHLLGKSISALLFSIILHVYLLYIDRELVSTDFIADQKRDIFSIINYRQKYYDLKVEKEISEVKLIAQFEKTLTSISDGIVTLDKNWCYIYINKKAGEFLGRTPESLIGKHIWTEFPEIVGLPIHDAYIKAFETQETQIVQVSNAPQDKWFENRIYPTLDGLTIYYTDITEKKRIERALNESESFTRGILSSLSAHLAVIDNKGDILAVNKAWNDFSLVNGEHNLARTSVGSNYIDVCHKAIAEGDTISQEVLDGLRSVLNKEKPNFEIEYPCHSKTDKRWFTMHVEPFGSESDKLVISHTNITQLKIAEEQLENINIKLKEAQRIAKIGNWEFNPVTKAVFFSDEIYNILEIDQASDKDLFKTYRSKCLPKDYEKFDQLVSNAIQNREGYTIGYYIKPNENTLKYIQEIGEIVTDDIEGNVILKGTIQDITEDKMVNATLIQKNEELVKANNELDRFVYSASHDLRSPLTSLRGLIQIIEMGMDGMKDEDKKPFHLMTKTIDKMDKFIADILDYSINARTAIADEKIDLKSLIKSCWVDLEFMFIDYRPNSKLDIKQTADFVTDQKRVEIIINNLISNAFKYHDKNKTEHFVNITIFVDEVKATIIIEDNGIGINEKNIDKIFDMFHRATKLSTGSGMGLYIVKEALEKIQGTITVESELEKGTKFSVEIPNQLKY